MNCPRRNYGRCWTVHGGQTGFGVEPNGVRTRAPVDRITLPPANELSRGNLSALLTEVGRRRRVAPWVSIPLALTVAISGCSGAAAPAPSPTPTSTPTPTVSAAPTPTPTASPTSDDVKIESIIKDGVAQVVTDATAIRP